MDDARLPLADEIAAAALSVAQVRAGHSLPASPGLPDEVGLPDEANSDPTKPGLARNPPPVALPPRSRAAIRDMAYATVRQLGWLSAVADELNHRALDPMVAALQLVALQQLIDPIRAPAVIVDQAVRAAAVLPATRAAGGLINAVLRRFLRERDALTAKVAANLVAQWNFPAWWIADLQRQYAGNWEEILTASSQMPSMTLRVNQRRTTLAASMERLRASGHEAGCVGRSAIRLGKAVDVHSLPGFDAGELSVQDAGAQLAAWLLDVTDGQRVLDACAAPGGKTAHLLEAFEIDLLALDRDSARINRIVENLARLGLNDRATVRQADAIDPAGWWDGRRFDRILVDAPCTASGVVRRHPEIRWLRQRRDIETFAAAQGQILAGLWPTLEPGGKLLYATCSVFPGEGEGVINRFLRNRRDARRVTLTGSPDASGKLVPIGQMLPHAASDRDHDGFFYALVEKLT